MLAKLDIQKVGRKFVFVFVLFVISVLSYDQSAANTSTIYDDSLQNGWENWSWATVDLNSTIDVQAGSQAASVDAAPYSAIYFGRGDTFSTAGYNTISFWLKTSTSQTIQVRADQNLGELGVVTLETTGGVWKQYEISLNELGVYDGLTGLWISNYEGSTNSYIVDDVTFISSNDPEPPGQSLPNLTVDLNPRTESFSYNEGGTTINYTRDYPHPISDYIYGINFVDQTYSAAEVDKLGISVNRWGGNGVSRYNWLQDVSNSAHDFFFYNNWNNNDPSILPDGSSADTFVETNRSAGTDSMLTIPMMGWVTKERVQACTYRVSRYSSYSHQCTLSLDDFTNSCGGANHSNVPTDRLCGNGYDSNSNVIPPQSPSQLNKAFTTADAQNWINHLTGKYGTAANGGVKFYSLDNEPFLWNDTHFDIHPNEAEYAEVRDLSWAYGSAIKAADPSAETFGPALWGWPAYDFVPYYLDQMAQYENNNGQRILDYLDIHYYPQNYIDDTSIALKAGPGGAEEQRQRFDATKSLWDANWVDESWINTQVRLIPRMQNEIAQNYPNTKLALTEYNFGGYGAINGALVQADVLGILGREGVDLATMWKGNDQTADQPWDRAFRMYRDYDGNGSKFGNISLYANSTNQDDVSIYAAQRASDGAITVIVINKTNTPLSGNIDILGLGNGTANAYRFSNANLSSIVTDGSVSFSNDQLAAELPSNSITLYVIDGGTAPTIPTATPLPQPTATSPSTGPSPATLNGVVYQDSNGNSVRDSGENLAAAALVLFQDSACDGAWVGNNDQWIATIEVSGNYSFNGLQSGDCYFIQAYQNDTLQSQTETITLSPSSNEVDMPVPEGSPTIPTATPTVAQPTPTPIPPTATPVSSGNCDVAAFDPTGFSPYYSSGSEAVPISSRPNAYRLGPGAIGYDQTFTASVDGGTEYVFSGEYKTDGTQDYNIKLYIGDDFSTQFSFNIQPTTSWQPFEVRVTAPNASSATFRTEIWKGDGSGYLDIGNMSVSKVCAGGQPSAPTATPSPVSGGGNVLRVVMDRSASIFNRLYFTDVTLKIDVGGNNISVRETNGGVIAHAVNGQHILVTTDKSSIDVIFGNDVNTSGLGSTTVTTLKDNKAWAWSHGLDDNMGWREAISVLSDEHGYAGMLYFITDIIDDNRDEDWITDKPKAIQYLNNGWSLGNHTADHNCSPSSTGAAKTNLQNGFNRLMDIVNDSAVPDYKITAFAAPCLESAYHPAVLQLRAAQTTHILFNEGKSPTSFESDLMRIDSNTNADVSADGRTALAINFDSPIGRYSLEGDLNTSYGQSQLTEAKAKLDWMSQNKSDSQHFWFNTLAHGNQEAILGAFVDYLDQNYKNEAWVAPADQIYSYMLVRDNISVSASFTEGGGVPPTATLTPTPTTPSQPPSGNVSIDIANLSGVSGYSFAVFGAGFGNSQGSGSVQINGTSASITSWRDGLVEGIVPNTSSGATTLRITSSVGDSAENPFTVYTINPTFLQPLTQTYQNVIFGKEAVVVGITDFFCYDQTTSSQPTIDPSTFLTDFTCGTGGYSKEGEATFTASSGSPAIIAVDAGQSLSGRHIFQFFSEANWYQDGGSYPAGYEIQVSSNSTNGVNGSWQTLHTETDNARSQRMHVINIPAGNDWIRMRATQGNNGNSFSLSEVRLYDASSPNNAQPDSYALYGDSLTADAFNMIGRPTGTANDVKTARGTANDIIFTTFGLSGQNSSGFLNDSSSNDQIHDAFALDNMDETIRFWGLAIGSNDASQGRDMLAYSWTNISQYDERLEQVVQDIIADGNVPIVARIPEIIPSNSYQADFEAKKKILQDIDRISAEYRLIPGPDFYSIFRENIEFDGNTFIGGDGIHHTREGQRELVRGWAETFANLP